ncbi:MAG: acyl-CoA synthetase FdrA [Anaerolineales bacterium]
MSITKGEIRSGAYYDSVILMQLQRSLAELPGVIDAGVIMGTQANKELLEQSELLAPEIQAAGADDMVIVIKAEDQAAAQSALESVDRLIAARRSTGIDQEFLPKSLETAARMLPDAGWVLISVPGRYAAGVTRQALDYKKHVFLYSDNVTLMDEIDLKKTAAEKGLLVMGPDCGTAIVNGIGLGFANKVRRGPIGLVAGSGTGLQQVTSRIHQFGGGITHALGTGGRDLSEPVGAVTAHQGLSLLSRDPETKVIVLVSKPPARSVADELVIAARKAGKPVVVDFIGYATAVRQVDNVYFATSFDDAASLAVRLSTDGIKKPDSMAQDLERFSTQQRYLRGLFSGGTLAYEALLVLEGYLPQVYSNVPLDKKFKLEDSLVSKQHTILDLGEDEFTVGRLHPMMDNDLRLRRLEMEADDPEVAVILLDVVLGYGAHPDPASELAPAIKSARTKAGNSGRYLEVIAVVSGTDQDPQDLNAQIEQLEAAGARVFTSNDAAASYAGRLAASLDTETSVSSVATPAEVDLGAINQPMAAINFGLETFTESLVEQGAPVIQVDWRPPASGNEQLMGILERMKSKS